SARSVPAFDGRDNVGRENVRLAIKGRARPVDSPLEEAPMLAAIDMAVRTIGVGYDRLNDAAARIAGADNDGDLVAEMVELNQAAEDVRRSVEVLRTANESVGTLLNVMA